MSLHFKWHWEKIDPDMFVHSITDYSISQRTEKPYIYHINRCIDLDLVMFYAAIHTTHISLDCLSNLDLILLSPSYKDLEPFQHNECSIQQIGRSYYSERHIN